MSVEFGEKIPWWEEALQGVPPEVAARYREMPDYLDRALRGIDEQSKVNALRAMVNLGVRPDDETNVIIALLGYYTALAKAIPEKMQSVVLEMTERIKEFEKDGGVFTESMKRVMLDVVAEISAHALELGRANVQTSSIEEIEKHRYRLTILTKEVLEEFKTQLVQEARRSAVSVRTVRERVLTAVATVALLLLGVGIGWFASTSKAISPQTRFYARQGQTYVRMWNDASMPAAVRSWIRRWSVQSTHAQAQ